MAITSSVTAFLVVSPVSTVPFAALIASAVNLLGIIVLVRFPLVITSIRAVFGSVPTQFVVPRAILLLSVSTTITCPFLSITVSIRLIFVVIIPTTASTLIFLGVLGLASAVGIGTTRVDVSLAASRIA